jgi:hypothetical protein
MFRDRRKVANKYKDAHTRGSDEEVFAALPDRTTVDIQVTNYFQAWETTYRILHGPSFWKEYQNFWEQPSGQAAQPGFAVILLLIGATTKCLNPKDDVFEGDTTADRQMASNIIKICEAWIGRQPRKRLTLQFFQLQCLALVAKRVNCDRVKQGKLFSPVPWNFADDWIRLDCFGRRRSPSFGFWHASRSSFAVHRKDFTLRTRDEEALMGDHHGTGDAVVSRKWPPVFADRPLLGYAVSRKPSR